MRDRLLSRLSNVTDKSEAVEFAEWISVNKIWKGKSGEWFKDSVQFKGHELIAKTTQELYSIFKQSKTK